MRKSGNAETLLFVISTISSKENHFRESIVTSTPIAPSHDPMVTSGQVLREEIFPPY